MLLGPGYESGKACMLNKQQRGARLRAAHGDRLRSERLQLLSVQERI